MAPVDWDELVAGFPSLLTNTSTEEGGYQRLCETCTPAIQEVLDSVKDGSVSDQAKIFLSDCLPAAVECVMHSDVKAPEVPAVVGFVTQAVAVMAQYAVPNDHQPLLEVAMQLFEGRGQPLYWQREDEVRITHHGRSTHPSRLCAVDGLMIVCGCVFRVTPWLPGSRMEPP